MVVRACWRANGNLFGSALSVNRCYTPKCCHLVALQNNVPAEIGDPGSQQELHVQQQIIIRSDGVQMRIVRIVNVDPGSNQDISAQLAKILHDTFENDDSDKEEEGKITEEEGKIPAKVDGKEHHEEEIDKIVKAMAADSVDSKDKRQKIQAAMGQGAAPVRAAKSPGDSSQQAKQPKRKASGSDTRGQHKTTNKVQPKHGKHGSDRQGGHKTGHHKDHKKVLQGDDVTVVYNRERVITVDAIGIKGVNPSDNRTPPPSMFRWLAPSKQRYTLLRDEL